MTILLAAVKVEFDYRAKMINNSQLLCLSMLDKVTHTWAGSPTAGGGCTPGGWGVKNFSAAFGGRKISPRGRRRERGGGRKFFYPGGSLLVKIGQNFFTWGVIW